MKNAVILTAPQARKLALLCQHLPVSGLGRGLKGTHKAIRHLGYIQIDTISVVERAHHHTLWNRVPYYRHRYLDKLVEQRAIFEYWSHAAAYLPVEDYRFCLPRMKAIASGQRHWYKKNTKLMNEILERIRCEGPLQAKDFEAHRRYRGGMWEWGPVKQAIEYLFMQGDLLVTRRDNFQKVFDLAENVIPSGINHSYPTKLEYAHFLIERFLSAHGIGHITEFGYLRQGMGQSIKKALDEKLEQGEILAAKIKKRREIFYVLNNYGEILNQRLARSKVRILSPFDNLVIQRKRIKRLFGFDYQIECYVPAAKRVHGYFVLPILWQGRLVARMDAKADRNKQLFMIRNLTIEPELKNLELFSSYFSRQLDAFAQFNQCREITCHSRLPKAIKKIIFSQ